MNFTATSADVSKIEFVTADISGIKNTHVTIYAEDDGVYDVCSRTWKKIDSFRNDYDGTKTEMLVRAI